MNPDRCAILTLPLVILLKLEIHPEDLSSKVPFMLVQISGLTSVTGQFEPELPAVVLDYGANFQGAQRQ
jgi:hypothetical protein